MAHQLEGLCLLLGRMAYPCRYSNLIPQFGRPAPELSMISNCVIDDIFNQHAHLIKQWNHEILNPYQLEIYADAIHTKGAALNNFWICRWDCQSNILTNREPGNYLQWTQKDSRFEIPVCNATRWAYGQHVWT